MPLLLRSTRNNTAQAGFENRVRLGQTSNFGTNIQFWDKHPMLVFPSVKPHIRNFD
jgi:hypothetical protein